MAAPFLALSPARSPARRCRVLLRGVQLSCPGAASPCSPRSAAASLAIPQLFPNPSFQPRQHLHLCRPSFPTLQVPQARLCDCSCHLLIWGHPARWTRLIDTDGESAFKPLSSPQIIQMLPEKMERLCSPIYMSLFTCFSSLKSSL